MKMPWALPRLLAHVIYLLLVAPFLLLGTMCALALADLWRKFLPTIDLEPDQAPAHEAISVVIPNWNGRDLLAANLPSVIAALAFHPDNEVIVVENGSADGSAEFLEENFPAVKVVRLETNRGFGGGSNEGFRAARHDVVLLLNNDMRVEAESVKPLLEAFADARVFAVTAQIYFSDPRKRREETGLVHGMWVRGSLHLTHRDDQRVREAFPTFYAGGGSSAYDRRKFLSLGGFDPLMEPFYYEDTDISYMAWKRGWKLLYEPRCIVHHEYRATIGKHFHPAYINAMVQKNRLLFVWKNIHQWSYLAEHFSWLLANSWVWLVFGSSATQPSPSEILLALRQLPAAVRSRICAARLAVIPDAEAFRRPLGGYFRDRFGERPGTGEKLHVLFVSPYPLEPPVHGGGVFMNQTVRELAKRSHLHLFCLLDEPEEAEAHESLRAVCASTEFMVRWKDRSKGVGLVLPQSARAFFHPDMLWAIHRAILIHKIDVVQFEYTQLATYAPEFERVATFLFEHDIAFQSISRAIWKRGRLLTRMRYGYEYLRVLRFELQCVPKFDGIQVCTAENRRYLESFIWDQTPIHDGFRAGIDVAGYPYQEGGRDPGTLLFVGNFRHLPNREALAFFVRCVFPEIWNRNPQVRLVVAGAQAPPGFEEGLRWPGIEYLGRVDSIQDVLARYAVFVCPVLSGSGIRVKLLEAFASGIPVVSTAMGAEGLTARGEKLLEIADSAEAFARRVTDLLDDPDTARHMARRARREVEQNWDMKVITRRLEAHYREVLEAKLARGPDRGGFRYGEDSAIRSR